MKKNLILVFLIGFVFSKLRTTTSPCVLREPNSPGDCYSQETEFFQQTCCYFIGTYQNSDGQKVTGKSCLEAYRYDVADGKRKSETQKKIEAGTYWENYPAITDMTAFSCFDEISECEKMQPAENEDACFSLKPELNKEVCCYLESDWKEGDQYEDNLKSCVDIVAADVETEEGIQQTIEKIKQGTYWDGDYGYPTKVGKLVCKKASNSSTNLMINLFTLALIMLII